MTENNNSIAPISFMKRFFKAFSTAPRAFFVHEAAGGVFLLFSAVVALLIANSSASEAYYHFLHTPLALTLGAFTASTSIHHFINDGLMVIFFYYVGLEIKREIVFGELSQMKQASLPIVAAVGGMIVPALIYVSFNSAPPYEVGWGIPMATDIAFAVGVYSLFGKRFLSSLKLFLLTFAIIDDIGAVLVIALFYTKTLSPLYLLVASSLLLIIFLLMRANVRNIAIQILFAILVWACFLKSGVHATIAGVVLAFLTPSKLNPSKRHFLVETGSDKVESPLSYWMHHLHPWVSFLILPLFAFANAGITFKEGESLPVLFSHPITLGVGIGLLVGKPLGITLFSFATKKLGLAELPRGAGWLHMLGVGFLGGIGFTMSLFVGGLAFERGHLEDFSKLGIFSASVLATIFGLGLLLLAHKREKTKQHD